MWQFRYLLLVLILSRTKNSRSNPEDNRFLILSYLSRLNLALSGLYLFLKFITITFIKIEPKIEEIER